MMQASIDFDVTARSWEALNAALADRSPVDLGWIQPPPAENGWCLAPDALRLAARLVRHLQPRHILEFGSGVSTRLLAREGGRLPLPPFISSIDHDPEFAAHADGELAEYPMLSLQCVPLVAREFGGKYLPAFLYKPEQILADDPVDLVLVDGPPVCLGGREGTLYQAMDFVRPGALLLLDDANRPEEQAVLSHWRDALGDSIEVRQFPEFVKGLAAVVIRQPVPRSELWSRREQLTRAELPRHLPREARIVYAGKDPFDGELVPGAVEETMASPLDSDSAIQEFEMLRHGGAACFVFLWPAFWWFDTYAKFIEHVQERHKCLLRNDRVVVFDLRQESAS